MTDHDAELTMKDPNEMRGHGPTEKMLVWGWTDNRRTMSPDEEEAYHAVSDEALERYDLDELEHNQLVAKVWLVDESVENVEWVI